MIKKCFVIDTNVLLHDPRSLFAFEDNEVIIPLVVLDELDKKKVGGHDETARHARMVIRSLDKMRLQGSIHKGVPTPAGGTVRVELNHRDHGVPDLDPNRVDNRLIGVALGLKKEHPERVVTLITKDINLRVKCDALGVVTADYNADYVISDLDSLYSGQTIVTVDDKDIDLIYKSGKLSPKDTERRFYPNEYVYLKSNINEKHSVLARFNGECFEKIKTFGNIWGISSRNKEQAFALDALFDPEIKLVTITGRSGTGKTLISIASALSQLLDNNTYKKILLSKPTQSVDRTGLGFLPGTLSEKIEPWMISFWDNIGVLLSDKGKFYIEELMNDKIEIFPISYSRGRSLSNCILICDECQNIAKHEVKTMITRLGDNSKIVLIGDVEQIDTPYLSISENGLSVTIEKFKNEPIAAHITLTNGERSDLATLASKIL